jgi:hypothetical protein
MAVQKKNLLSAICAEIASLPDRSFDRFIEMAEV